MSTGLSPDFKETVRSRTNLVDLIGDTLSLQPQRGGADYVGLCPFHQDNNPSFHVYPDRQSWRCWVCNEGGDCFSFVEKTEGIGFFDSLKLLAERAGIEMPQRMAPSPQQQQRKSLRDEMFSALTWAEEQMHQCLMSSPMAQAARTYLQDRGYTPEQMEQFRLGYHPDSWEWILGQVANRYDMNVLEEARLVARRKNGPGYSDSHIFINRVIFPIHDARGRTISFGGRLMPGQEGPKYYNGNESDLFHKSDVLYGYHQAKDAIRRSRTALVVEGYTDRISMHLAGIENVVGVLGTALTEQHVSQLKLIADSVVLVYDGDSAGQLNADRVVSKFLAQDLDLKILTLPDGLDPEEYLKAYGAESFQGLVKSSLEAWEFKYWNLVEKHGLVSEGSRQTILNEMLSLMGQAPNLAGTNREDSLLARLSQKTAVREDKVRKQLKEIRSKQSGYSAPTGFQGEEPIVNPVRELIRSGYSGLSQQQKTESELLEIILTAPEWMNEIANRVHPQELHNPHFQQLYQICCDLHERGEVVSRNSLLNELEDADLKQMVVILEDWSHDRNIRAKLEDRVTDSDIPHYLLQAIQVIAWRREESEHDRTRGEIAGYTSDEDQLTDTDQQLLMRSMEFHKKRIQNKTTT